MAEILQSVISPSRNSDDVDFSDVFGGPPRRSSTQESVYSARNSRSFDDNDDAVDVGSPWLTSRERPVFGEAPEVRRRRYPSDDFFDDIFRGDQSSSSCQSPRLVPRRSPFSSAPGSRVMSPSRSLPSNDSFANPSKFSLPGRLSNTDFVASTSMSQSFFSPSLSRFNQTIENRDADSRSATRFGAENQDATNFHFSIYKWASKGVPLVISLRKKSPRSKDATKVDDAVYSNKSVRSFSPVKERKQHNDSFVSSMIVEAEKKEDYISHVESNNTPVIRHSKEVDKTREDVSSGGLKDATAQSDLIRKSSVSAVHKRDDPLKLLPKKKTNMRSLSSFLSHPNEDVSEKIDVKISTIKEKEKPNPTDEVRSHSFGKTKVHKSSSPTKNEARGNNAGKVKDFVKIFNQEPASKASSPRLHQSHSRRWKEQKNVEVDYEIRFSSARMNDEMEASFVNWGEEWPDTLEMDAEPSYGNQQFDVNDSGRDPDSVRQTSANVPSVDKSKDSATNIDATVQDDFQSYETKVQQWAKGKEGNIRALLSTLQYILWPDSGWKSIPLVDIIEANAVKRAYQKALLRLHPDKLQQKGAASHHKLIAEKVFDILQEAWGQFNSLESL